MTSKILTVSNLNSATFTDDNAEILSTFDPPLSLNIDTQFNFKSGFIDVVGLGNSGQDVFILDKSINANITVSYYEQLLSINPDTTNGQYNLNQINNKTTPPSSVKLTDSVGEGVDFINLHYILCLFTLKQGINHNIPMFRNIDDFERIEVVKNNINITIPAGTYSSDSIVEFLNIKLQGINKGLQIYERTGLGDNHTIGINTYLPYEELVKEYTVYVKNVVFPDGVYQQYLGFVALNSTSNEIEFDTGNFALNYYYPQQYSEVSGDFDIAQIYLGTSIFSLQNINDLLSFDYTHNPYFVSAPTGRTQIIELQALQNGIVGTTETRMSWRVRRGGINILKLEPTSFWYDILGFDDSILLNITTRTINTPNVPAGIVSIITTLDVLTITGLRSFDTSTTIPFIGAADYDANFGNTENTVYPPQAGDTKTFTPITVSATIPLNAVNAINYSNFNNGGHFLLSIEIGQNVNNFISNNITQNIISIMSREYLNDGFISVFDGGNPLLLSSNTVISYIRVNIIDPLTNKNALNLGNRNTFYFELG